MPNASEDTTGPGVTFEGVWKKFRTGESHDSLRDLIPALLGRATRGGETAPLADREFWAVKDVSFTVDRGAVLGILGANGAGKSTVLKLLTRVMRPTRGRIAVRGRIGALIEVAAGFHPDLTGRENVFLQGAILGMRAREVQQRFDAIVEFAGVSEFIDTPVKRYSTGMNARLGFAIAAHLEPDVLVTDEVLAVGDFAFQSRAFARLGELARSGIPVIVVSHQLDRIASLCTRALVMDHGAIGFEGPPAQAIAWYTASASAAPDRAGSDTPVRLTTLRVPSATVVSGTPLSFHVDGEIRSLAVLQDVEVVGVRLRSTTTGEVVSVTSSTRCGVRFTEDGAFTMLCTLQLNVPSGVYFLEVHPWDNRAARTLHQSLATTVTVVDGVPFVGQVQLNARMSLMDAESAPR